MGEWYAQAMVTDPAYLRLRQRSLAETDDPEILAVVRSMYDEILATIERVVRRGQEQGVLSRSLTPAAGAWLFLAIGHTMDLSRLIGLTGSEVDDGCHAMVDAAKRALIAGAS